MVRVALRAIEVAAARTARVVSDALRGRGPRAKLRRDVEELRVHIEYVEDSLALLTAQLERDDAGLRPWDTIRRPESRQRS
jgi:hypothetical protein